MCDEFVVIATNKQQHKDADVIKQHKSIQNWLLDDDIRRLKNEQQYVLEQQFKGATDDLSWICVARSLWSPIRKHSDSHNKHKYENIESNISDIIADLSINDRSIITSKLSSLLETYDRNIHNFFDRYEIFKQISDMSEIYDQVVLTAMQRDLDECQNDDDKIVI